ncbi:synaptic vesicle glycoprotein 2B isoform X1 [Anoplophora glabripennis]|uniref:synaptic vesicle glycoprotein 2B isoform X1 n=2 Tax=Anoplophora glabripennis TaxID=217634 RepID=UPI000C7697CB|nr:synaptic vesicle glycoprotein 2B isoform X1 [Anoplophora glabripennis]
MTVGDITDEKRNENGTNSISKHDEEIQVSDTKAASFEDAITATEFGKFNIFLMVVTMLPCFSQTFETGAISFVVPVAQCDLNLSLEDKGVLNAMVFAGMITSGFFWGYLSDSLGRKRIITYGYFLNGLVGIMGSMSPNILLLMIAKFFNGLLINGPFESATSYLSEFHSAKYRARVQMVRGIILSFGNVLLPLIAWGILPRNLDFKIFDFIDIHAWNVFLLICTLTTILGATVYLFMPESPKFLMSAGRNEEALKVFETVYRINTGRPRNTFPIKFLVAETNNTTKKSTAEALLEGMHEIKSLFQRPYIFKLLLACTNCFLIMMSANTLKLWLPQLFQAINDFQYNHNGMSSDLCTMLEDLTPTNSSTGTCSVNLDNKSVYINSIVVGASRIVAFLVAGPFVNMLGKKKLIIIMTVFAGSFSTSIYFAQDSSTVLVLSSMNLAFISVSENVLSTVTLELFPTTLRTVSLSLHMMSGRIGTILGNVIFSYLLYTGCAPPFVFIGLLAFGCAGLSLLYPNTENKELR